MERLSQRIRGGGGQLLIMQSTIAKPVGISGIGLHSGCQVSLKMRPAPPDTGIVFRRIDLRKFEIEAHRKHVSRVVMATTLMKRGVMLSTVEHVLSALYGSEIDNVYIDIDSLEVPILDGSAKPFIEMVGKAGRRRLDRERTYLKVDREIVLKDGDKSISVSPDFQLRITYEIDFVHPMIGRQRLDLKITPESYASEIAFARTFGFLSEVEQLRRGNLIRGGSLDNAVVLSEDGILNGQLRADDEFVRHKALDLIGDIALCGYPLLGHIKARKAGHALHTALATELVRNSSCCRTITESELVSAA